MATFLFWVLAGITIGSAAFIGATRRLIHAAFALFVCLAGVAGLFAWQGADFIAAAQVIVYVGGVLILLMFGVMLSRRSTAGLTDLLSEDSAPVTGVVNALPAALVSAGFFAVLVIVFARVPLVAAIGEAQPVGTVLTPTQAIGIQNLTAYLVPFEVAGVLLLLALIGAAYVSRRPPPQPRDTGAKKIALLDSHA